MNYIRSTELKEFQDAITKTLSKSINGFHSLNQGLQDRMTTIALQGAFGSIIDSGGKSLSQYHVYLYDIAIAHTNGNISQGYIPDVGKQLGKAHLELFNCGVMATDLTFECPHRVKRTAGKTREYRLNKSFYDLFLQNYCSEKMLLANKLTFHKNTRDTICKIIAEHSSIYKTYKKEIAVRKYHADIPYNTEEAGMLEAIKLGAEKFAIDLAKCKKKITYQSSKSFNDSKDYISQSIIDSPEFHYRQWLNYATKHSPQACMPIQGKRRLQTTTSNVKACQAFMNVLSFDQSEVTVDKCGRMHAGTWECMPMSMRKYLLTGNARIWNFDLECCQLVIIAKIIGATTFLSNYDNLGSKSIWSIIDLMGMTKSEAKTLIYTYLFKNRLSVEMGKLRNKFFKVNSLLFGDFLDKLKSFHKSFSNNKYQKNATNLIINGYRGLAVNVLGLPFSPEKDLVFYACKKTGEIKSYKRMSNVSGKYLAHLAQGYEQSIIQPLFAQIDYAFAYQYDGFFLDIDSLEDIANVQRVARSIACSVGLPEIKFTINKL